MSHAMPTHILTRVLTVTQLLPDVRDEHGRATDEYVLLAFSDDPERWGEHRRHVRTFSPSVFEPTPAGDALRREGLRGLPPGGYFLVALDDLAYEDVGDASFLESLVRHASRIVLSEGERRVVSLRRIVPSR